VLYRTSVQSALCTLRMHAVENNRLASYVFNHKDKSNGRRCSAVTLSTIGHSLLWYNLLAIQNTIVHDEAVPTSCNRQIHDVSIAGVTRRQDAIAIYDKMHSSRSETRLLQGLFPLIRLNIIYYLLFICIRLRRSIKVEENQNTTSHTVLYILCTRIPVSASEPRCSIILVHVICLTFISKHVYFDNKTQFNPIPRHKRKFKNYWKWKLL